MNNVVIQVNRKVTQPYIYKYRMTKFIFRKTGKRCFSKDVVVYLLSRFRLFATSWTVAHEAPLSMGFSRKEHWSGLSFPSPGNLPDPGN